MGKMGGDSRRRKHKAQREARGGQTRKRCVWGNEGFDNERRCEEKIPMWYFLVPMVTLD